MDRDGDTLDPGQAGLAEDRGAVQVGFGETARRSAPEFSGREGGWLAAPDDFRN